MSKINKEDSAFLPESEKEAIRWRLWQWQELCVTTACCPVALIGVRKGGELALYTPDTYPPEDLLRLIESLAAAIRMENL